MTQLSDDDARHCIAQLPPGLATVDHRDQALDAARYRWLRQQCSLMGMTIHGSTPEAIDRNIDAAMSAEAGQR